MLLFILDNNIEKNAQYIYTTMLTTYFKLNYFKSTIFDEVPKIIECSINLIKTISKSMLPTL